MLGRWPVTRPDQAAPQGLFSRRQKWHLDLLLWALICGAGSSLGDKEPWIYKKGPAFGMPGVHVDGMDVLKVRGFQGGFSF